MDSKRKGIDLSIALPDDIKEDISRRLIENTKIVGECFEWTAGRSLGYGEISIRSRPIRTHVVSYSIHKGTIPPGMVIRHRCDNPPCWNPAHLEIGTQLDNIRDMQERGRAVDPPRRFGEKHPKAVLTDAQVAEIRDSFGRIPQRALAKKYGTTQTTIWRIGHRITR